MLLLAAEKLNIWWPELKAKVHSRMDLLIYFAGLRFWHPHPDAEPEEELTDTVRQQAVEALALLHR